MNYPTRLLPKPNYKIIKWSNELCPLFLLRYTLLKELLDDTNKLKEECITKQTDHLRDLSTYLLGVFLIEDNKIDIIEKGKDFFYEWNEGEKASEPIYNVDFKINDDKNCFYWNIEEISSLEFSHTDHIDNKRYKLNFKVLHTPVKCNFWHFSIRTFLENQNEISTLAIRSSLKRTLWQKAKEQLRICAETDIPNFSKLNAKYYEKQD